MKKKNNYDDDSENEFEVDDPDEVQENSDDEWAPAAVSMADILSFSLVAWCNMFFCVAGNETRIYR